MSVMIAQSNSDERAAPGRNVMVARQPIFARDLGVHGYELVYRSCGGPGPRALDSDAASAEVITSGFMDIGLNQLVANHLAYFDVSRDLVISRSLLALPADRVALQFPGDAHADADYLEALDDYLAEGYRLVFSAANIRTDNLVLLKRAHAVRLDLRVLGLDDTMHQLDLAAPLDREVIVCNVDDEAHCAAMEAHGAHYFQGRFFARPRIVEGTRLSSSKLATLRLLAALYDPESGVDEVSRLVEQDAALSYKLVRLLNSASLSLPTKVDSIQRAVVLLGLAAIKRWASLMVVASIDDKPSELTRTLLLRARLCELLCAEARQGDPASAFTVGLFSGLDALVDLPLCDALAELPLIDEVRLALLDEEGVLGEALACALAYERGEWSAVRFSEVPVHVIGNLYVDAAAWARNSMQGL